jgi:hypothetical protein
MEHLNSSTIKPFSLLQTFGQYLFEACTLHEYVNDLLFSKKPQANIMKVKQKPLEPYAGLWFAIMTSRLALILKVYSPIFILPFIQ